MSFTVSLYYISAHTHTHTSLSGTAVASPSPQRLLQWQCTAAVVHRNEDSWYSRHTHTHTRYTLSIVSHTYNQWDLILKHNQSMNITPMWWGPGWQSAFKFIPKVLRGPGVTFPWLPGQLWNVFEVTFVSSFCLEGCEAQWNGGDDPATLPTWYWCCFVLHVMFYFLDCNINLELKMEKSLLVKSDTSPPWT